MPRQRDEIYVLDLCDTYLQTKSLRQYSKFTFLKGDTGRRLPVDAYYPDLQLVVEYHEIQHTRPVPFFDKIVTASGISRREQRAKYDELRRIMLPANGIELAVLSYEEFLCTSRHRLIRLLDQDSEVVAARLGRFLPPPVRCTAPSTE